MEDFKAGYLKLDEQWLRFTSLEQIVRLLNRGKKGAIPIRLFNGKLMGKELKHQPQKVERAGDGKSYICIDNFPQHYFVWDLTDRSFDAAFDALSEQYLRH